MAALLPETAAPYVAVGVIAFAAFLILRRDAQALASGALDVAAEVVDAVNPINQENVFYTSAGKVAAVVTGAAPGQSLGSQIYDFFHPNDGADLTAPTPIKPKTAYGQ